MKLTNQAAIEAKREDSSVVLYAEYAGKTFGNVSENLARQAMERGGAIYCYVTLAPGVTVEPYRLAKSHDQIVIERHQRKLAGKGLVR